MINSLKRSVMINFLAYNGLWLFVVAVYKFLLHMLGHGFTTWNSYSNSMSVSISLHNNISIFLLILFLIEVVIEFVYKTEVGNKFVLNDNTYDFLFRIGVFSAIFSVAVFMCIPFVIQYVPQYINLKLGL